MKTQNAEARAALATSRKSDVNERPFGVSYQWAGADGTIFHGRTVASGRDESHAQRRFFRQYRHVLRTAGSIDPRMLVLVVTLALVILGMAVNLASARAEVRELKAALNSAYNGQVILTHEVVRIATPVSTFSSQPTTPSTNGGAQ